MLKSRFRALIAGDKLEAGERKREHRRGFFEGGNGEERGGYLNSKFLPR
jgi:hypothetical protein